MIPLLCQVCGVKPVSYTIEDKRGNTSLCLSCARVMFDQVMDDQRKATIQ